MHAPHPNRPAGGAVARLLALSVAALLALALPAAAATVVGGYTRESYAEYEHQLASHEIVLASIDKRLNRVHLVLRDGRKVFATYPKHFLGPVTSQLQARHVPVTVMTRSEQLKEASEIPVHHKWRYVIGGVVIAVIVIVAALMLYRRRRALALE